MNFFFKSPTSKPKIYAYTETSNDYKNLIKIGYTTREVLERMQEHYPTKGPNKIKRYKVLFEENSMRSDGTIFNDKEIHRVLSKNGIKNVGGEWFECSIKELKAAISAVKNRTNIEFERTKSFKLRPEQNQAVIKTSRYFKNFKIQENKAPHFLWNCKMRFGKTFAAYKLAETMSWSKILILTFKPAIENSWRSDLLEHIDFKDWQFFSKSNGGFGEIDKIKKLICFGSFQDFLGKSKSGGIKVKNKWIHKIKWDCIILDEYHYGAWRDTAKELYENEEKEEIKKSVGEYFDNWDENISPLKTSNYLYLSGTPFRAIESGEFLEEQIFNWTYSDEQREKKNWTKKNNPYEYLPKMVMLTYQMPESLTSIINKGEFDEFDLNVFFKSFGKKEKAEFKYKDEVQKWLNFITGDSIENIYENLKIGKSKPVLPFSDTNLLSALKHTFWFLPSVSACYAMKNLLLERQNYFFHNFEIIVCAGNDAGIGEKALNLVKERVDDPVNTRSITLSCGKLTTGVTVKPWSGIFMLRNTSSPETYFQTAFRVQSPWTIDDDDDLRKKINLKENCYLFDFSPNRALKLITDYCCRLNINEDNPEEKVNDFIKFLPILCFNGSTMNQLNSNDVLDYGLVGTSGSQLAKKFESTRLVNVDNEVLEKLLNNKNLLDSLMQIEGFRNLNKDLEKIINNSEKIKKIKTDNDDVLNPKDKKELTDAEKEYKSLRKDIQKKLQKFATRIPVFMYLTEFRERTLKDVITQLEPGLFRKVTGVSIKDFEKMISLGLFNSSLMNSAVFSFKRYENASLYYADGFTKYKPEEVGLFDTVIKASEL